MGLSSSKTTSTTGPSPQALPYLTAGSTALQSAYNANQPNTANIGTGLYNAFQQFQQPNQTTADANTLTQQQLTQPYSANPELGNQITQTNNDIQDRINALFSQAGQTGSSRQEGELAKQELANESNLKYTDYNNYLTRQQQAVTNATALGGEANQTAAAQAALGQSAATVPYTGAQILASGLGSLWGNSQTNTTTQSGNLFQSLLGAGAQVGAGFAAASDRRLKTDIERVGELDDGLPLYLYRYITPPSATVAALMHDWEGGDLRLGVMADEVAKYRPWAMGPIVDGYSTVDYGHLPEIA